MMSGKETETGRYRLSNYIISIKENSITASEFTYFKKENIIREIAHPAEIDKSEEVLIIKAYYMSGSDTRYTIKEFSDMFLNLPLWNKTMYYLINDKEKNNVYLSGINIAVRDSKQPMRIIK